MSRKYYGMKFTKFFTWKYSMNVSYPNNFDNFISTVISWASRRKDIYAVLLVGSYATGKAKVTSDIDLCILVDSPDIYLSDVLWAAQFGVLEKTQIEYYGKVTSVRVNYKNSFEVEYSFTTPDWASIPVDNGTIQVVRHGAKILYDPLHKLSVLKDYLGVSK